MALTIKECATSRVELIDLKSNRILSLINHLNSQIIESLGCLISANHSTLFEILKSSRNWRSRTLIISKIIDRLLMKMLIYFS